MRTLKPYEYEIERETIQEQCAAGRWHPAQVVTWKGHRYTIGAGSADELDLFEEGGELFVIATNKGLGYVGAQIFRDGEEQRQTFIEQYDENGDYLLNLTPIYRAKRIANWLDY